MVKLVKESLEQGFTRGSDNKLSDLGVGKIPLIKKWLNDHYIRVYTINEDFSIDIPNDVELSDCLFGNLPDYIQFGTFKGDFDCNDVGLTTMKGFPKHVAGNFSCYDNNLTSCEFAPEFIGESCSFTNNPELSDITGFPKYIGSDLFIRDTKLSYALIRKSLAVKGDIFVSIIKESTNQTFTRGGDDKLKNIGLGKRAIISKWLEEHRIKQYEINDDYTITVFGKTNLMEYNLSEFPDYIDFFKIDGDFNCDKNGIKSLRGCPKIVTGYFSVEDNGLTDDQVKFFPDYVGGHIYITGNKISSTMYNFIENKYPNRTVF